MAVPIQISATPDARLPPSASASGLIRKGNDTPLIEATRHPNINREASVITADTATFHACLDSSNHFIADFGYPIPLSTRQPLGQRIDRSPGRNSGFDAFHPAWPAQLVAFLATEAAGDINGQGFIVWGGPVALVKGWHTVAMLSQESELTVSDLIARKDELFAGQSKQPEY